MPGITVCQIALGMYIPGALGVYRASGEAALLNVSTTVAL